MEIKDRAAEYARQKYAVQQRIIGTPEICKMDYTAGASDQIQEDIHKIQGFLLQLRLSGDPMVKDIGFEEFQGLLGAVKNILSA